MVWIERDLNDHPVPLLAKGRDLPAAQFAPSPVRPGLELLYSEKTKSSKHIFLLLDTWQKLNDVFSSS